MALYHHEHTSPVNRFLHVLGIPLIFAGIAVLFFGMWRTAIALFAGGWILLFLGHRIEGNRPAFFQGPIYFLVGPIWVIKELWGWITGRTGRHGKSTTT